MQERQAFEPGSELTVLHQTTASPHNERIMVKFPSRVHLGVVNLLEMGPARAGGGAIASGTDHYPLSVRVMREPGHNVTFFSEYYPEAKHMAELFREATQSTAGLGICISSSMDRHCGFGSSSALMAATGVALNELYGRPFSNRELRELIGHNYVEPSANNPSRVVFGNTTGSCAVTGMYGGLSVMMGLDILAVSTMPETYAVLTYLPDISERNAPNVEGEMTLFQESFVANERQFSAERRTLVEESILPALCDNNLGEFYDAMKRFNDLFLFSQVIPLFFAENKEAFIDDIKRLSSRPGVALTGMSSAGPSIYAVGERKALSTLADALETTVSLRPRNIRIHGFGSGLYHSRKEDTRSYRFQGDGTD